jgi:hypothetical protein
VCLEWLAGEVATGPVPVTRLRGEACDLGLDWNQVMLAKQTLGVVIVKSGGTAFWRRASGE